MDFDNLLADETRILDKHFTKGRQGHAIDKVIIHHNDGNLTVDGCYDVWQSREASAHYQVASDGTIGQLVYDRDTAWHAGNWPANISSIGIEHADCSTDPYAVSDACLDAGAHLVAAVCVKYGLGRPEWGVNLFGHSDFASTECPGELAVGGSQHDAYVARAQSWYDQMTGAKGQDMQLADIVDPHYYYAAYADVANAYGDGARSHFSACGAGEGRRPSAVYDHDWYRSHYSDLDAAFGDDAGAYATHFVTCGAHEGRRASREFDPAYYRKAYADLDAAFGDDWESYYRHYLAYGQDEGRTTHDPSEDAA